jgi:hypothetical protein
MVGGQISPRKLGLVHKQKKVGALNDVQDGQDHQPRRLVDKPINVCDGLEICVKTFACRISGKSKTVP